jgi:hypothetical protein
MNARIVPPNDPAGADPPDEAGTSTSWSWIRRTRRPLAPTTDTDGRDGAGVRGGGRAAALLAVALIGARIAAVPITLSQDATFGRHAALTGDIRRFHSITSSHHGVPYQDFPVEYPPVMLGAIELLDSSTTHAATVATMWSQLALDLAVAVLILWGWGRRASLAYLVIGFPLVCYPFLYLRLDLLSVALAIGALALLRHRRPGWGGAVLAVAAFSKLWPLLLAPSLVVRRSWRALATFVTCTVVGLVAWVAWVGTDGPIQVFSMRGAIGWEIESTVGAVIRVTSNEIVHYNEGAFRVGHVHGWAIVLSAVVLAVAVITAWLLAGRSPARAVMLDGNAALAAIGVFLVCTPLLSPQFAIWLVPFAAIAAAYGDRIASRLTLIVVALSVADFALIDSYANTDSVAPRVVVLLRNGALIALVVASFVRLARSARGVAAPRPAESVPEPVAASPVPDTR